MTRGPDTAGDFSRPLPVMVREGGPPTHFSFPRFDALLPTSRITQRKCVGGPPSRTMTAGMMPRRLLPSLAEAMP